MLGNGSEEKDNERDWVRVAGRGWQRETGRRGEREARWEYEIFHTRKNTGLEF